MSLPASLVKRISQLTTDQIREVYNLTARIYLRRAGKRKRKRKAA